MIFAQSHTYTFLLPDVSGFRWLCWISRISRKMMQDCAQVGVWPAGFKFKVYYIIALLLQGQALTPPIENTTGKSSIALPWLHALIRAPTQVCPFHCCTGKQHHESSARSLAICSGHQDVATCTYTHVF